MKKQGGSKSLLVGVGFSMGANILGNHVARAGHRVALDTAIVISGSLDKRIAAADQRSAKLWHAAYVTEYRHFLLDGKLGSQCLEQRLPRDKIKSIFSEITANKMTEIVADYYGFDDVNHYYAESSILGDVTEDDYLRGFIPTNARIHNISIPMLVVHALDDPVLSAESVVSNEGLMHPDNLAKSGNGNLMILLTKHGGHVGWPMGWNPHANKWKWTSNIASSFVEAMIKAGKNSDATANIASASPAIVLQGATLPAMVSIRYWNWRNNPFRLKNPGPAKKASFWFGTTTEALSYEKPTDAVVKWLIDARNDTSGDEIPFLVVSELLGETNMILIDPAIVKEVLMGPAASDSSLYKRNYTFAGRFLGEGVLTLDGSQWHRHRRILNPCFGRKLIKDFVNHSMPSLSQDLVSIWKAFEGNVINVENHFTALMIDAIGEFGFSGTMGALDSLSAENQEHKPPVADAMLQFITMPSMASLLLHFFNLGYFEKWVCPKLGKARAVMKQTIEKEILAVRASIANGSTDSDSKSILPVMLQAKDTEPAEATKPKYLNDKELRDEVLTFIASGFETTKTLLTWSIAQLCQNKDMQSRLFEEIFEAFGGDNSQITADTVDSLPYLASFIKEVLRLYPPASVMSRFVTRDAKWKHWTVPAGTRAYICIDILHRDPDHWIKPNEFRPERWTNGEKDKLHRCSYIPFGAGGQSCIGQNLALLEAKIVLATLVQTFEMELAPHHKGAEVKAVGLFPKPKEGLDIIVVPRRCA